MDNKCWGCGKELTTGDMNVYCHDCGDWGGASYRQGFAAGYEQCRKDCEAAVIKIQNEEYPEIDCAVESECPLCALDKARNAIRTVKMEVK